MVAASVDTLLGNLGWEASLKTSGELKAAWATVHTSAGVDSAVAIEAAVSGVSFNSGPPCTFAQRRGDRGRKTGVLRCRGISCLRSSDPFVAFC